ncbi:MAG TPA: maleylpyruvate isomerase N-terminal domain-containing protein [Terriglobia bacterium]|nr:maleylpyruvate isomerase N-terminal domain-containing protein [Terriglobia bacterium]
MRRESSTADPILCAHLLRRVDERLIDLLSSLTSSEWDIQTAAPLWKVRDVAAHLLDTALRKLSMARDSCYVERVNIRSPQDLITLVNCLNREGVTVYRRLSPPVLIDMMRVVCEQSARFHESLDPFAPATFAVTWAGEETSLNWFDTARELTERWHHQQQIRLATNRPGIMTPELYYPVLDCLVRGLPYLYRDVDATVGTSLLLEISGECGGRWLLSRGSTEWGFVKPVVAEFASRVTIPQELAWRVFTKGIDRDAARRQIEVEGNRDLAEKVFQLTAVVG